jgi:RHS repeat-associated protein
VTTYYVGNHYEVKSGVVTKYYFAGTTRLAVRTSGTLSYLLGDHIGSSSVTTDANGVKTASALYKAFGETRYTLGNLGTDYKFTNQREEAALGIYFFNSRWFDPTIGRFIQPDSIIPYAAQGTQAWDRYAYVNNNPVRYTDPTGHCVDLCIFAIVFVVVVLVVGLFAYGSEWDPEEPGSAPEIKTPNNPANWFKDQPTSTSPPPGLPCLDPNGCLRSAPTATPTVSPTPTPPDPCNGAQYCYKAPNTTTPTASQTSTPTPTSTSIPLPTGIDCMSNPQPSCYPPPQPTSTATPRR